MPRIRSLKPEMLTDEKLAPLPVIDRFVFVALILLADDAGRLLDNVKLLDGQIFSESNDSCGPSLERLAELGIIVRYRAENGQRVIQIRTWEQHQRVDHRSKFVLPPPPLEEADNGNSRDSRESLARVSEKARAPTLDLSLDHGSGTLDLPRARAGRGARASRDAPGGDGREGKAKGFLDKGGWELQGSDIAERDEWPGGQRPWGDTPVARRMELMPEVLARRGESGTVWGAIAYVVAAHEAEPVPGTEHAGVRSSRNGEAPGSQRVHHGGRRKGLEPIGQALSTAKLREMAEASVPPAPVAEPP